MIKPLIGYVVVGLFCLAHAGEVLAQENDDVLQWLSRQNADETVAGVSPGYEIDLEENLGKDLGKDLERTQKNKPDGSPEMRRDHVSAFDLHQGASGARSLPGIGVSPDAGENTNSVEPHEQSGGSDLFRTLQLTLANNPAVHGKSAEVLAQEHILQGTRASRLPAVTTQANNLNETRDQGSVALDQPLYAFGRIRANIRRESERLRTEKTDLLRVQRGLLEEAALAYANVLNQRAQLETARGNVTTHQELQALIIRRERGQLASQADIVLAESRLLQAVAAEERARARIRSALSELQSIAGTQVNPSADFDIGQLALPDEEHTLHQLALGVSVDIRQKEDHLSLALAEHSADSKALLPTVSLRVEQEFLDDSLVNIDQTRVGLVFQSSVEGLGLVGRRRVAGSAERIRAARFDVTYTRDEVNRRVDLLNSEWQLQLRLQRTYHQLVQALRHTSASTRRQYEAGRRSWLDLLNIQREVNQHQELYDQARHEAVIAQLRLAAMCGLLDVPGMEE